MKIVGIALILVGVVAFLNNMGVITAGVDWNTVWPLLVILVGFAIKHCKRCVSCGSTKCVGGVCKMEDSHKCEGPECGECKK